MDGDGRASGSSPSTTRRRSCSRCRRSSPSLGLEVADGVVRARGAAPAPAARVRRHPARREHAGDGRLRDGRAASASARAPSTRRSSSSRRIRDDTHAARGYSLGAVDYILAPVEPEVLRTKVASSSSSSARRPRCGRRRAALERRADAAPAPDGGVARDQLRALSPGQMLQVVAEFARDILGAHQAVAIAAPDQKWNAAHDRRLAVRRATRSAARSTRPARPRRRCVTFLSETSGAVRRPSALPAPEDARFFVADAPSRLGWLAAPLTGRDGRPIGLLHLLDKMRRRLRPRTTRPSSRSSRR